jgi:hypothetical protein
MSLEKTLSLVDVKRPAAGNPIVTRRVRLVQQINEQLELVQETRSAPDRLPQASIDRRLHEEGAGDVQRARRARPWWWSDPSGVFYVSLRYARRPVELAKGKTAVKCESLDAVANTLAVFKSETLKGTFDAQLAAVAAGVRQGFGRTAAKA